MVQRQPFIDSSGGSEARAADVAPLAPSGERPTDEHVEEQVETGEAHRAPIPFVWQHGRRLLLLDDEPPGWVMAELRFDVERCRYVEVRRATYDWAREAIGAVLSRALASGEEAAWDSARCLHTWLSRYYGIPIPLDAAAADVESPESPS